jgi:hypothetical protein
MVNFPTFDPGAVERPHREYFQRLKVVIEDPYKNTLGSKELLSLCAICTAEEFKVPVEELFLHKSKIEDISKIRTIAMEVCMENQPYMTKSEVNVFFKKSKSWYVGNCMFERTKAFQLKKQTCLDRVKEIIDYLYSPD